MIEQWQGGLQIDLLFMDIEFTGEENGLYYSKQIFAKDEHIPIVFITNYAQFAIEGYEVNALRFITKPPAQEKINECMSISYNRWVNQYEKIIVFNSKNAALRVPANEIIYLEVKGHYTTVYHEKGCDTFRMSMDEALSLLAGSTFVRCHRSYLVNMVQIRKYQDSEILMANQHTVPIGRNYFTLFIHAFRDVCLGERR